MRSGRLSLPEKAVPRTLKYGSRRPGKHLMSNSRKDITTMLRRSRTDVDAREKVFQMIYGDLRRLAGYRISVSRPGDTLSVTSLVNEAYLKLTDRTGQEWNDRNHFMRVAAKALRQITIDHVRAKLADKRGGGQAAIELNESHLYISEKPEMILALEEGLEQLSNEHPRLVNIVECRFFAGLSVPETADALGVSVSTVERDWRTAKHWLKDYLS
jgi:RNA polymerase sigma factor (TIGR02999 family)